MVNSNFKFLTTIVLLLNFIACNEIDRRAAERMTKSTEEEVSKSKKLQDLEKICRELPFFDRIQPTSKSLSKSGNTLFYDYKIEKNFNNLKELYKNQLPKSGWRLTKEESTFTEDQIEFENEQYQIHIAHINVRDENYAVSCTIRR